MRITGYVVFDEEKKHLLTFTFHPEPMEAIGLLRRFQDTAVGNNLLLLNKELNEAFYKAHKDRFKLIQGTLTINPVS